LPNGKWTSKLGESVDVQHELSELNGELYGEVACVMRRRIVPAAFRHGRWLILAAALLWSSSGLFAKATIFDDWPKESRGMILAFWRALFAGMLILPAVRRPHFRWAMAPMAVCFALMNATYLSAVVLTKAANAIWLQSTAPLWIFLAGAVFKTGDFNRRDLTPLACGLVGVATILAFEVRGQGQAGIACGLASGVFYAGVVLSIRRLRDEDSAWLVAVNHLTAAVAMLPYVVYVGIWPSPVQLAVLAAFGFFQMGLPYLLFARGLRSISSQEASLITLLEPVLMPIWVYLAWSEQPDWWTLLGGGLILIGLLVRYGRRSVS
jgi:drug/metabolite transporter (DMT)-like permease